MSLGRRAGGLTALVLALSGCARLDPVVRPAAWDRYGERGPLAVRGASPDLPGPTIVRALRREPGVAPALERHGDPDAVVVYGGRWSPKRMDLVYRRAGRRIAVDRASDGWVARAPEALPARGRRAGRGGRATARRGGGVPQPAAPPTVRQTLECPIDPARADCQALCVGGARHEWCP